MSEPAHHHLSISAWRRLLQTSHSSCYYAPVPETDQTLALMTVIDETFTECPWYTSRQTVQESGIISHATKVKTYVPHTRHAPIQGRSAYRRNILPMVVVHKS